MRQIRRTIQLTGDPELSAIEAEVLAYPNVASLASVADVDRMDDPQLLVPFVMIDEHGEELSMFTTLTTFGTPRDVTLDELSVELFFPADEATDRILQRPSVPAATGV